MTRQQGGHRQGQLPRQGAPGRPAVLRRRVRARDHVLARRDPEADLGGVDVTTKVRDQELEMARQLIEGLTADGIPRSSPTSTARRSCRIVEAKINGEEIEVVEAEPTAKVVDLMEALKASVAAAKKQPTTTMPRLELEEVHRQEALRQEVDRQERRRDCEEGDRAQEGRRGVIEDLTRGDPKPGPRAPTTWALSPSCTTSTGAASGSSPSPSQSSSVGRGAFLRRHRTRHRRHRERRPYPGVRPGHVRRGRTRSARVHGTVRP